MQRKGIENLSLTGKVEGKRARGRQRMTYLSNIKEWTNTANGDELIQACQDREIWKSMTTQRRKKKNDHRVGVFGSHLG